MKLTFLEGLNLRNSFITKTLKYLAAIKNTVAWLENQVRIPADTR